MSVFAVVPAGGSLSGATVMHEPAVLFDEPPETAVSVCGVKGFVYMRAGFPNGVPCEACQVVA